MRSTLSTSLIGMILLCLAATAADAVQGRAYVEREKQIYKMAKSMATEAEEVKAFGDLLEELDSCDLEESSRDFWRTARSVKTAMELELAQVSGRAQKKTASNRKSQVEKAVQQAEMLEAAPMDSSEQSLDTPLVKRAHRMEMIYREAEGLRNPMSMNDASVIKRYRLLVGEFHQLMKEEVRDRQDEIDELRALNKKER